jgi:TM2 domain-containing membrane protein YozV
MPNNMPNFVKYMPEVEADELLSLTPIVAEMNEEQIKLFAEGYRIKRKTTSNMWLFLIISFLGIGGAHRFYLGQIGMGILYLLTVNICYVGLLIDLFSLKSIVNTYNMSEATKIARLIKATNQQQEVQVKQKDTASGGFCIKCGSELISGKDFCGNCGAKVFIKTCEKCGSELISGKNFCVECGVQISSEEIPS